MSRAISIRAPKSLALLKVSPKEIEQYVEGVSTRVLESLPEGVRPAGINMVKMEQVIAGTNQTPGGWAEWTRACCGKRHLIDDFVMPSVDEMRYLESPLLSRAGADHAEVQLRVVTMEYPEKHRG